MEGGRGMGGEKREVGGARCMVGRGVISGPRPIPCGGGSQSCLPPP
jgi:hypothetical protein